MAEAAVVGVEMGMKGDTPEPLSRYWENFSIVEAGFLLCEPGPDNSPSTPGSLGLCNMRKVVQK